MAIQLYQEDDQTAEPQDILKKTVTKTAKRTRWATQKAAGPKGLLKRQSILRRLSHRNNEKKRRSDPEAQGDRDLDPIEEVNTGGGPGRKIYFNIPLPADARDEEGHPLTAFPRNKIRTAKYTPLSFIPKNLWFQFQNIANIYFLLIIILGFFQIFGVDNPGLSAVPLIVIVIITAIKDAIEDTRRTMTDNELNNAPIHRLSEWSNVNSSEQSVGPWRRIKKATSHSLGAFWHLYKSRKTKKQEKGKDYTERALDVERPSNDTRRESAMFSQRNSLALPREENNAVEMTPVHSPTPGESELGDKDLSDINRRLKPLANPARRSYEGQQTLEVPKQQEHDSQPEIIRKNYGSLVNPLKESPEKARFKRDAWKDVQVGDFVRLYNDEQIPADVVILSTSDHEGVCYVETKNLDGETNLKVRNALHAGQSVKRARDCEKAEFVLESEPPHANLYAYSGVIRWLQSDSKNPDAPATEMAEPIGINNVLLRGCSVRNTEWVLGVVVFTGQETKIMLNSGITPSKRAHIAKTLNYYVLYNFVILFCMCLVSAVVEGHTWGEGNQSLNFFEFGSYGGTPGINGLITFFAAVILYQNLVPISLYISLEIIRTIQAFFIYSDTYMYYEKIDYPCTPKSWNISDDLGQIEYIFSDKTGTLTQNVMEFKKATVNGVPYGEAYTEALAGMQKRQGIDTDAEGAKARKQIAIDRVRMLELIRKTHDNPYLRDENLTFVAPDYIADLNGDSGEEQQHAVEQFMLALALCHTVLAERLPGDPPRIDFKAQSPDEAALVATARDCGFTVLPSTSDDKLLNIMGQEKSFSVLNILEFNSARKRMSIIIRMPDNRIVLYCKGADSIIYSRLKKGEQPELRKATAEQLEMFAREGLRTLCIAQRYLSEAEYKEWNKEHELAAASIQKREERLEEVSDKIEQDLTLLGGTAIEDRLQDGVPDSIALLGQAGIKLWVLTGDKVETAINIGFSCNLLSNEMELILLRFDEGEYDRAEAEIDKHLASFGKTGSDAELKAAQSNHEPPAPTHALIIDGDSLRLVLDERLRQKFLLLCKECKSVLCCRVSPAQKAAVVAMVKNGLRVLTLSIGDGANDVAMIQEAHVGVGIAGEEGRQAVMSSDYAIGQFRFLTRLLLVHGRWSYRRLAETIANFFYKNIVWTFALFWYNIYANFDCVYAFDYTYILLYNLAFTSLPIIFMGILDQDVDDKISLAVPQLYRRGIARLEWTQTKFWFYMIDGLYQSLMCFFMPYLLFRVANTNTESGRTVNDYKEIGVYIANATVIVVNVYIMLNVYRWDWFLSLIAAISILLIFFWTGVYTSFTAAFTFYGSADHCYGSLSFWALTLFVVIICLLPRFAIKSFQKMFMPYDIDIVREQVRQGHFDYLKNVDPLGAAIVEADKGAESTSSSEISKPNDLRKISTNHMGQDDDRRPMYPPSVTNTATTYHPYSPQGSDGTAELVSHRTSLDRAFGPSADTNRQSIEQRPIPTFSPVVNADSPRASMDRPRPSYDRVRNSMDFARSRPSFEQSNDFTSAAYLTRIESSRSDHANSASRTQSRVRDDITDELRR